MEFRHGQARSIARSGRWHWDVSDVAFLPREQIQKLEQPQGWASSLESSSYERKLSGGCWMRTRSYRSSTADSKSSDRLPHEAPCPRWKRLSAGSASRSIARSVEEDPSLLESPHRPLRSADEVVGEADRFREPIPGGAGKDDPLRAAQVNRLLADLVQ